MTANLSFPLTFIGDALTSSAAGFASGLAAASTSAATANTAILQAALNAGGNVQLPAGGLYYINSTLTIYSDAVLNLNKSVIRMTGGVGATLLRNSNWNSTPLSVTSAATSFGGSYHLATVTLQVANTFVSGEYILVKGVTPDVYNGVHRVLSATASTVTFIMSLLSAVGQPTGTITVAKANGNITVCNGTLDYDVANNPPGTDNLTTMLSIWNKVGNINFTDLNLLRAAKYCVYHANSFNLRARGIYFETFSDGIHGHAPVRQCVMENMNGWTGDDFIAFTCSDSGYTQYALPDAANAGDGIKGFTARNLDIWNTTTRIGLYTRDAVTCSGILIDGVTFRNAQLLCIHTDTTTGATTGGFRDVTIKNVRGNFAVNGAMHTIGTSGTMTLENVSYDGLYPDGAASTQFVYVSSGATVNNLTMRNFARPAGSTGPVVTAPSGAVINNAYFEKFDVMADVSSLHGSILFAGTGSTVGVVTFADGVIDTNTGSSETVTLLKSDTQPSLVTARGVRFRGRSHAWENAGAGKLTLENCVLDGGQSFWTTGNAADIEIIGGRVLSASQGVVNFYGAGKTCTIRSRGLDDGGVTWMVNYGAGSTYNFPGDNSDVPVDLTKIARLAGSQVKAASNAGTILANNVCVCDATATTNSWKQLSNTTLTY